MTIVKTFRLHGYSASHGSQEPALREAIADIERGDYSALIVTESSRLDRREDLDGQAEILLCVRPAGGGDIRHSQPQLRAHPPARRPGITRGSHAHTPACTTRTAIRLV